MSKLLDKVYHYFVPGESNNQRAKVLHPSFLSLFVAIFIFSQFFLQYFSLVYPQVLGYAANISVNRLIELTNQRRAEQGLPALTYNETLSGSAGMKAGDMFALDYWAHNSPTGRSPWDFIKSAGYGYIFAGENLARDFNDSEAVVAAWMNSPTHRENLLNGNYQEIGIAVVNGTLGGVETTLVVQHFGTPATRVATVGETEGVTVAEAIQDVVVPKPALASGESTVVEELVELIPAEKTEEVQVEPQPVVSPFAITKGLAMFMGLMLIGVMAIDLYLMAKKKTVRLSGRTWAHLGFILFVLVAIYITERGLVL